MCADPSYGDVASIARAMDTIDHFRIATEDNVTKALSATHVALPIENPTQFVEA